MVVVKLSRARSARSGASRVRGFSYVCILQFFVLLKSSICLSVRPPLHDSGCVLNPRQEQIVFNLVLGIHVMISDSCQNRESADQCLMAVSQTQVYNCLRWRVFWSSPLTSYGIQVIAGSENFPSESKLPRELHLWPWLKLDIKVFLKRTMYNC